MSIADGLLDAGVLGIAGFGVWRGQGLWSRHIELKHERGMERLGMDRMEKSIRLEMDQVKNLAEIEQARDDAERVALQRTEIIATERLRVQNGGAALNPGDS